MKKSKLAFAIAMLFVAVFTSTSCTRDNDLQPKAENQELINKARNVDDSTAPKKKRKKR